MRTHDREDNLYSNGKRCQVDIEEAFLLGLLKQRMAPNSKLIDIGCGTGDISLEMQKMGYMLEGVDFSKVAVEIAQQKGLSCKAADLDYGIPYEENSFDAAWAGDVIEHVFDPTFVLAEIKRVVKPGGLLFATIPYNLDWTIRLKTLSGYSYQEGVYAKYGQYKHHTFFSERLMRFMFDKAGLRIEKLDYVIRMPLTRKRYVTNKKIFRILSCLMIAIARV